MKILIVTEVFYPESGLINDFVPTLQERGHEVEVLTQYPSYPYGHVFDGYNNKGYSTENWNGIKIHRFRFVEGYRESVIKKILNYRIFVREGKKIARKIGNEYDHVLVYQTGPLTVALPAVEIKRKFGKPLTVWTFDIWPDAVYAYGFPKFFPLPQFLNHIIRKVYRACDNILVSSRMFGSIVQPYVPQMNIEYAPNWLILEETVESSLRFDSSKLNFTFTGNISISQNLENVLRGWKLAALNGAVLNIVGDGSSFASLQNLIEKEGIKNVALHGRYPSNQIADILRQSDILVLSLIADRGIEATEPFKLQSYLKAGKPILGVIRGSGREIIEENNLGICAKPNNIKDIAEKFAEVVKFAEERGETVAEKATELLEKRFNREKTIEKVISTIEQTSQKTVD